MLLYVSFQSFRREEVSLVTNCIMFKRGTGPIYCMKRKWWEGDLDLSWGTLPTKDQFCRLFDIYFLLLSCVMNLDTKTCVGHKWLKIERHTEVHHVLTYILWVNDGTNEKRKTTTINQKRFISVHEMKSLTILHLHCKLSCYLIILHTGL